MDFLYPHLEAIRSLVYGYIQDPSTLPPYTLTTTVVVVLSIFVNFLYSRYLTVLVEERAVQFVWNVPEEAL